MPAAASPSRASSTSIPSEEAAGTQIPECATLAAESPRTKPVPMLAPELARMKPTESATDLPPSRDSISASPASEIALSKAVIGTELAADTARSNTVIGAALAEEIPRSNPPEATSSRVPACPREGNSMTSSCCSPASTSASGSVCASASATAVASTSASAAGPPAAGASAAGAAPEVDPSAGKRGGASAGTEADASAGMEAEASANPRAAACAGALSATTFPAAAMIWAISSGENIDSSPGAGGGIPRKRPSAVESSSATLGSWSCKADMSAAPLMPEAAPG
mmetsp:Transcript_27852/g.80782  ORF Transcript_27852/g.80782 Transcript_27852/m.80782 type:complete len:283 (-) Transcript_27852:1413-2261(-)